MKVNIILSIALVILLASCGGAIYSTRTEPCTTSVTGDTVALAYKKPVPIFEKCADNMTASIISINDSRCPAGVQCVWAGTVSVVLQMGDRFNVTLEIGKAIDTTFQEKKFSFSLIDVRPYPAAGMDNTPEKAVAVVRILKSDLLKQDDEK